MSCARTRVSLLLALLMIAQLGLETRGNSLFTPTPLGGGRVALNSAGQTNRVFRLEQSRDLKIWNERAILHDGPLHFVEMSGSELGGHYYRLVGRARTSNDDGKNQVLLPADPFANLGADPFGFSGTPSVRWIKFAILLPEENRVEFQDSNKYPFHFDFAVKRIARFSGLTRAQFDDVTLRTGSNQKAVLGAVLFPGDNKIREAGIQFVGQNPYTREEIVRWFELAQHAVTSVHGPLQLFYMPAYEQGGVANAEREWFAERGVQVGSVDRWLVSDACYSEGWAIGRLVYVPAAEIADAYASGRLKFSDILVTDQVPAEAPFVAGIVTLAPATPNSHVAILARSFGIPFGWSSDSALRSQLPNWNGQTASLRVGGYQCKVLVTPLTGDSDPGFLDAVGELKKPKPLTIRPVARLGVWSTNATDLKPSDSVYVGGKAANFGVLRRTIPNNSPPAIALSFDLWQEFLDQTLPDGARLRDRIRAELSRFQYPPDVRDVREALARIRTLIRNTATFTPSQQARLLEEIGAAGFDPKRNLRFRSSTNVEDSESYTGAGLYDSYSGCLADDTDADAAGPSLCDASEKDERGVFRAIRRVYASFYNDNAYLERLRLSVSEDAAGMALLVHHSYPDSDEAANGVVTATYSRSEFGNFVSISHQCRIVTQLGAVSVTNPEGNARPEVVESFGDGKTASFSLRETSSLVPLGGTVLTWESDYRALEKMLYQIADAYRKLFPGLTKFGLDFEYKKTRAGLLEIKQVRRLPDADAAEITPILIHEPAQWVVLQGEHENLFAIHRLKSFWNVATRNIVLNPASMKESVYRNLSVETILDGRRILETNGPTGWNGREHKVTAGETVDVWTFGIGAKQRRYSLQTSIPKTIREPEIPLLSQAELTKQLAVDYTTPEPALFFSFTGNWSVGEVTNESVRLVAPTPINDRALLQTRVITKVGVKVQTQFYWPEEPRGISAGYTAPAIGWKGTVITGLASKPISLNSDWSQSYHPYHHNFSEEYLFEPGLDPTLESSLLDELRAKNIRLIYCSGTPWPEDPFQPNQIIYIGFDGKARTTP